MSKDNRGAGGTVSKSMTDAEFISVVGIGRDAGAGARAEELSKMLREDFRAIGDDLLREPINDIFTLLVLLGLERAKKASVAEKKMLDLHGQNRAEAGKKGAENLHNKPGGSREMADKVRTAWATGDYSSRDKCAEIEGGKLGISFSAARKALRKTPDPT